jgi:hypothetical protein
MEKASPTDLELQNNMAIVDECGNAGKRPDHCKLQCSASADNEFDLLMLFFVK